jgi:hypothetical protein
MFRKIVNLHFDHLEDKNSKVILVVHKSFGKLIHSFGETLEPYLSEIIPRLLINLTDKRENVNSSANVLLNSLSQRYGGDKLINYFVTLIDIKENSVVTAAALEFLSNQLIKATDLYFKDKPNVKKFVKRIGRIIFEKSADKSVTMPALGCLLALRDLETHRTVKAILNLSNHQLELIRNLADSYAPDLASNLSTRNSTEFARLSSSGSNNFSNSDQIMSNELVFGILPENAKTTPFFNDYDKVMTAENPLSSEIAVKHLNNHGFTQYKPDYDKMGDIDGTEDNDSCTDCINYLKRISIGSHAKNHTHKVTSKSKPYYTHILIEHYLDEETISQIIDELMETKDATHNATELLHIISNLMIREEPPVLQSLIKTMKYIISKCSDYELLPILKDLMEPLVTTFNHPHANVRKSVVF